MQAEIDELVFADAQKRYENGEIDEIAWKRAELAIYLSRRDINALRDEYNATRLIAPVSGRITYISSFVKGASIEAGKVMFTISDMDNLIIRYTGADSNLVPIGADAQLTFTERNGTETIFTGVVTQNPDTVPEGSSDKNSVLLVSDNLPEGVSVGSKLQFLYVVERSENALFIRTSSIKTIGDRNYVYIVQDGYRQERDVIIGLQNNEYTEIIDGLTETDAVIR
ncbi:MAG: HlyD family efflux transporter periplasmic adaptor subunit [Clostridia bacterium]|nr:HlyD family efflux transporter periplasmic adaptor subunit [Clostridia bacterium]